MATEGLSTPTLIINNDVIKVAPNTIVFKLGLGEKKSRATSTGGGGVEIVTTDDVETKISSVKFTILSDTGTTALIRSWRRQPNAITLTDPGLQLAFSDMVCKTDPEVSVGADGQAEVEFEGPPAV